MSIKYSERSLLSDRWTYVPQVGIGVNLKNGTWFLAP
jgi:hypothetical protein